MRYRIQHETAYEYASDVLHAHHILHLVPRPAPFQQCLEHSIHVKPATFWRRDEIDAFGNVVTRIEFGQPHRRLTVLTQMEVDRLLHKEVAVRERTRAQFAIGESVKVISGPLSDFSGEISEINEDAARLKVLVSIFGRETPVEVGFDQVKKL